MRPACRCSRGAAKSAVVVVARAVGACADVGAASVHDDDEAVGGKALDRFACAVAADAVGAYELRFAGEHVAGLDVATGDLGAEVGHDRLVGAYAAHGHRWVLVCSRVCGCASRRVRRGVASIASAAGAVRVGLLGVAGLVAAVAAISLGDPQVDPGEHGPTVEPDGDATT